MCSALIHDFFVGTSLEVYFKGIPYANALQNGLNTD